MLRARLEAEHRLLPNGASKSSIPYITYSSSPSLSIPPSFDPRKKIMAETIPVTYEGSYCTLSIEAPAAGTVVLRITGTDVGELGALPMQRLENFLVDRGMIDLYIDARSTRGASTEVSSDWALWLAAHRSHFKQISMLTGSRFIRITAAFVRTFASLEDVMCIYTDADAFDEALAASVAEGGSS